MPKLYRRTATQGPKAMIRQLIGLSLLFWPGTALAEVTADLVAEQAAAESVVMIPPATLSCGKTARVKPNDPNVQAQGDAQIPLAEGETYLDRMDECCAEALSDCIDNLATNIGTVTQQAQCSGCTCPDCGAVSCQPTFEFPDSLWGGGNIESGDCTAFDDKTSVSCRQDCWVKRGYWGGWFAPKITIGCSKCKDGHNPVEPPAINPDAHPRLNGHEVLSAW